jgi:hypothetical protein
MVGDLRAMALDALRSQPFDADMFVIGTASAAVAHPAAVAEALEAVPFQVRRARLHGAHAHNENAARR